MYEDKFATADGKARFVAHDYTWTAADPLAFLPEEIKPNSQYPLFVTTVRYQTVWQSGYTYRWLKELPSSSVPFMEFVVNPQDAKKAGLKDGDWAELTNQYSATARASSTSPTRCQPGLDLGASSAGRARATATDGDARSTTPTTWSPAAPTCSRSPTARSTRTRAGACASSSAPPQTAKNTPGLSEKDRYGTRLRARSGRQPEVQGQELRLGRPEVTGCSALAVPAARRGRGQPSAKRHRRRRPRRLNRERTSMRRTVILLGALGLAGTALTPTVLAHTGRTAATTHVVKLSGFTFGGKKGYKLTVKAGDSLRFVWPGAPTTCSTRRRPPASSVSGLRSSQPAVRRLSSS